MFQNGSLSYWYQLIRWIYDGDGVNNIFKKIFSASFGTLIEWYDFYIFGVMIGIVSKKFFPPFDNSFTSLLLTLLTFAVGFIVRPFGSFFFGCLGDIFGRKKIFLSTLLIMGFSTFFIGLLPTYDQIGFFSPIILIFLRLFQGLAIGGEYVGAILFVGENSPQNKRGFYTSFIQTTATLGLISSLVVLIGCKTFLSEVSFDEFGWRLPFLFSLFFVFISYFSRKDLNETPVFEKIKKEGKLSENPIKESFSKQNNRKMIFLALFGITAGQGVIWYTSQFYSLYFLQNVLRLDFITTSYIVSIALILAVPFFILFGFLSDKFGRLKIILTGFFLSVVFYIPLYKKIFEVTKESVSLFNYHFWYLVFLIFIQVIFVSIVYGPIAAYLIEIFPAKIRYTSISIPYHIGNGVFGGLVPFIGTFLVGKTGDVFSGLYFTIIVVLISYLIAHSFLRDFDNYYDVYDE